MENDNDAHDLEALQCAVNDSARDVSLLWSSFTLLGVYLAVAAASVTHRDLFLDKPVRLPILDVELPIDAFFAVAPVLYVASHTYLLLQLFRMVDKLSAWQRELREAVPIAADRQLLILRLTDFPFLRFLAERQLHSSSFMKLTLMTISWLTLTLFPTILLLQMQIVFLPFHQVQVTWLHRIAIGMEFAMAWTFWIAMHRRQGLGRIAYALHVPAGVLTATILIFSMFFAVFPGEAFYNNAIKAAADSIASVFVDDPRKNATPLSTWLFDGEVNSVTERSNSVFTNRIILPGESFYDGAHADRPYSVSLRGRDLQNAILRNADLRDADFRGADLTDADLTQAHLQGAHFECSSFQAGGTRVQGSADDKRDDTGLPGAHWGGGHTPTAATPPRTRRGRCTKLDGALFVDAQAANAVFDLVELRNTNLTGANL